MKNRKIPVASTHEAQFPDTLPSGVKCFVVAALSISAMVLQGQGASIYSYSNTSSNLAFERTPSIGDASYSASGYDLSHDQDTRMSTILNSGQVLGSSSRARGVDLVEDYEFNWFVPGNATGRWLPLDGNGTYNNTWNFATVTNGNGPFATTTLPGNSSIIAMGDESYVFFDGVNISQYTLTSGNYSNTRSWTQLGEGGTLSTVDLSWALIENNFIGMEQGNLGFLVGENTIEYYNISNGSFLRSVDYSGATEGPLSEYSLADIIDNGAGGYRYLGLDTGPMFAGNIVPEPSSLVLGGFSCLLFYRRQRR